jgi:serine/threonine protein kinase/WD40 repeat protein
LKVLPRHVLGDSALRQRFHREARAVAQLHHTNIVPVFGVGEDQDACWYAMQLILGQGLDQIIKELRQQYPPGREDRQPTESPAPPTGKARASLSQVTQAFVNGQYTCLGADAATPPSPPAGASPQQTSDITDSTRLANRTELSAVDSTDGQYYRSVARIGRQVAEALAHAHARGIIHRDIKPSNLLLDLAGIVWITDFGLAKTGDNSLTTTGDIVGTLRYMAPERFKGECDERVDVYGLGLTLYELLVLRPAFVEHDRLQLIDEIKNKEPSRPRVLDCRIPRNLETIVLKTINKEPKQRYASAEALAEDLRRFLANEPIEARRTSELERLCMWGRRNPALAVLSASLLVLLIVVAAAATMAALHLQATLDISETHREHAEKAELDGKHKLWLSYLRQARARRTSRQSGQRFASLRSIKEALELPVLPGRSRDELRTEAIAALCLPALEMAREGGSEIVGARGFTIDAAFERYAIADKDGKVSIRRLSDDEQLLQLAGGGLVSEYEGLQFSPDGRFLHQSCKVQGGCRSRLWDLDGPQPRAVLDDEHVGFAFRPDSGQCAASYSDGTVRFFDTASGRELRRFRIAAMPLAWGLSWNPKLPQLLLWEGASLQLLNVDTGEVAAVGPKFPGVLWVDWHPEGRLLAVSDEDLKIHLWDVPNGRRFLPPLEDHKHSGIVVKFNHAGDRLLSTDWSGSWHLWDTRSGRLLLTHPAGGTTLHFSPDDRLVGSGGGGKVQLFHFRRGEELCTVVHRKAAGKKGYCVWSPSIDPEGRLCALGRHHYAEGVTLVDVARGEESALLPLPGNVSLCFDHEGALWTSGSAGLLRWPMAANPKTGQRRYGPPQRILPNAAVALRGSADLRVVAIPNGSAGGIVIHRDSGRLVRLGPQEDVRFCAVSPDGHWVATGSHWLREGVGAKVWDAREGKQVKDLPVGGGCGVCFSPDGKWLLTTSGGCRLWAVGSWEEGPRLSGRPLNASGAFSCDGKLLALGDEPSVVRLVVTDTGAEIARLTVPEQARLLPCCFTPDGTKLVAVGNETSAIYVFDLTAIRAGLAELDLDWDAPPLPAASAPPAIPLSIQFDLGDLRQWAEAEALVRQAAQQIGGKEHAKGLASLRQAVKLAPSHAVAHNNLAWLLSTGPKELRDPAQALPEARKAVELAPDRSIYHNTLGVALYYTGHFAEAIPVLERSLSEGKGQTDAFDLFLLAMCHHRLGDAAKAKDCHERGKQWFQVHKGKVSADWVQELTAFQAEAESVLAQQPGQMKK